MGAGLPPAIGYAPPGPGSAALVDAPLTCPSGGR